MKLTDRRMGMIDCLYIRIYDAYIKKKDPARFAASLYVSLVVGLIFSPISFLCAELFHTKDGNVDAIILRIYAISILTWTFCTFNKKRIQQLKNKQFGTRGKYIVPTWCLFVLLPIGYIWAFFMYWLILQYVVHPYHLEGIIYKIMP